MACCRRAAGRPWHGVARLYPPSPRRAEGLRGLGRGRGEDGRPLRPPTAKEILARPGRTGACPEGEGACGQTPTGPGLDSAQRLRLVPPKTWRPRPSPSGGFLDPTRRAPERAAEPCVDGPSGAGPCPAEPSTPPTSRGQGPSPRTSFPPLSRSSSARDSAGAAGIGKAAPLEGTIAPAIPTRPSPATTPALCPPQITKDQPIKERVKLPDPAAPCPIRPRRGGAASWPLSGCVWLDAGGGRDRGCCAWKSRRSLRSTL